MMHEAPPDERARFVMHGARAARDAGLDHIAAQIEAIERMVTENPALTFDLARTLIESACRTILTGRSIDHQNHDNLPGLVRRVRRHVLFPPPEARSEAA